jgi:hypothetical protein
VLADIKRILGESEVGEWLSYEFGIWEKDAGGGSWGNHSLSGSCSNRGQREGGYEAVNAKQD